VKIVPHQPRWKSGSWVLHSRRLRKRSSRFSLVLSNMVIERMTVSSWLGSDDTASQVTTVQFASSRLNDNSDRHVVDRINLT
jgi:hypothetical protein